MKRRKVKDLKIFDAIRKPTAPPAKKIGDEKPELKVHPARRKTKHKKKVESDGDF